MYKQVFMVGQGRSGSHAIFYWVIGEYDVPVHIVTKRGFDFYFSKSFYNKSGYYVVREGTTFLKRFYDKSLNYVGFPSYSDRIFVFNMRDPYNHFAEWLKLYDCVSIKKRNILFKKVVAGWKEFAKEALGLNNYLPSNKVFVSYNKWFVSVDYRKSITKKLGLNHYDRKLNYVSKHGPGGDAFDGVRFNGKAQKMDVLNRWKHFVDDKFYRSVFDDEIVEYAKELFDMKPF